MTRLYLVLVALSLLSIPSLANQRVQGWCEQGAQAVVLPGAYPPSTTKVQRSFPACTVTVYVTGSGGTLATIYSDSNKTALSNPFTADKFGHWLFYSDPGHVDVQMSGSGLSSPYTIGDISISNTNYVTNVKDYGAKGDGTTDDSIALVDAHNAICAAGGGSVYYPAGVYILNPSSYVLPVCSNLSVYGSATIKVKPNVGDYEYMIGPALGSGVNLQNISFSDLTIDQNVLNNPSSIKPPGGCSVSTFHCYQWIFLFQSNLNGSVNNFRMNNLTMYFSGSNAVNANGGNTGNLFATNNTFIFEKRPAQPVFDSSAVYFDGPGIVIQGNIFDTLNHAITDGATTALEIHMGPGTVSGNSINWYRLGIYDVSSVGVSIVGNTIQNASYGMQLYPLAPMRQHVVSGNTIYLDQLDRSDTTTFGIGYCQDAPCTGTMSDISITDNLIRFQPNAGASSIVDPNYGHGIGLVSSTTTITGAVISRNIIFNAPVTGIQVGKTGGGTAFVTVEGNHLIDCGQTTSWAAFRSSITGTGTASNLRIFRNHIDYTSNPFSGLYSILTNFTGTPSFTYIGENDITAVNGTPSDGVPITINKFYPYTNVTVHTSASQNFYSSIDASQTAPILQDGSGNTGLSTTMATKYVALKFTASGSFSAASVSANISVTAPLTNRTSILSANLYSDSAGLPGVSLATSNSYKYGVFSTLAAVYQFGITFSYVSGTPYWIVFTQSSAPTGGSIVFNSSASGTGQWATSPDGTTWTAVNGVTGYFKINGLSGITTKSNSDSSMGASITSDVGVALSAVSNTNYAVSGVSPSFAGVNGNSTYGIGVNGQSTFGTGVFGTGPIAILGSSTTGNPIILTGAGGASVLSISATGVTTESTSHTLASLGTPVDGTRAFCSDCIVNTTPPYTCATTGSGAWAFRSGGIWKCPF